MTTYAQIAGRLLRDAAGFFRTIGEQNETLKDQMEESAAIYDQVATLVENDPTGVVPLPPDQA